MRVAVKTAGWLGLVLMAVGSLPSFTSSLTLAQTGALGSGAGYFLTFLVGLLSALLIVAGALAGRNLAFGIVAIIVGAAYAATFFGYAFAFEMRMTGGIAFMLLPGGAAITAGIFVASGAKRASAG